MNIAKIYQDATTVKEVSSETPEQVEEANRKQDDAIAHHKWLSAGRTIAFFSDLEALKNQSITDAVNFAQSYQQHDNHQKIIQALNKAHTLQELINTYGQTK